VVAISERGCQSREKQADNVAALRDIIEMKDADAFLAASGYAP
jgi:hypothetical protein